MTLVVSENIKSRVCVVNNELERACNEAVVAWMEGGKLR
jgi:hypothetical protein